MIRCWIYRAVFGFQFSLGREITWHRKLKQTSLIQELGQLPGLVNNPLRLAWPRGAGSTVRAPSPRLSPSGLREPLFTAGGKEGRGWTEGGSSDDFPGCTCTGLTGRPAPCGGRSQG